MPNNRDHGRKNGRCYSSTAEQAKDTRALPLLPAQMNFEQGGLGLSLYAYFKPDAQNLVICAGTRVLPIPAAIYSFACMDVSQ